MKKINVSILILTSAFLGLSLSVQAVQATEVGYKVLNSIEVGSASKWDFNVVDSTRGNLYLSRADHIDVISLKSKKLIATIKDTAGVHGFALASDLKRGFSSNGKSNTVTVFDLDTMQRIKDVTVSGSNPDVILYDPESHHLFVFNGKTNDIDVFDGQSLNLLTTIKASGRPEFAVLGKEGKIFFNIEDKSQIQTIDTKSNKITSTWSLKDCPEPTGLAIDTNANRLFSSCQNNKALVTDALSGKPVTTFQIGSKPDAIVYDATRKLLFTSNGGNGGSLSITRQVGSDEYKSIGNIVTAPGAKTMSYDEQAGLVYIPYVTADKFNVYEIGLAQ
jgi:DNA-binding beta-propeller fold protein YncE